ncbi:hypothetical protein [Sporomusa aerivorans]|uniref:hypothetical protein n=1 Tax=Sporomusa aerivorans TaxID=204936 RepID=UPI00352ACFE2
MKKMVHRMFNGFLSLVTTGLIMASPVAAVIYATEPGVAMERFGIVEARSILYTASITGQPEIFIPEKKPEKIMEKPAANDHKEDQEAGRSLTLDK